MKDAVIALMAKQPQVGQTKTRLVPALSPQQAVAMSEALLLDSIALIRDLDWADMALAITPFESKPYFEGITPPGTRLVPVVGEHIGECLVQAINMLLTIGYSKALLLNSDSPTLPPEFLVQAAGLLEHVDLVLGPAEDGGYYLIGMSRPHPGLFEGIAWSTEMVLAQTLDRARELGLNSALTPPWRDVDTADDLARFQDELQNLPLNCLEHSRKLLAGFTRKDRNE